MNAEPRSRFVTLDGLRFHVLEWGEAPRSVLILHGFSRHAWQATPTARALVADHRVIAIDQRGHGDTDWTDMYGTGPMVADVLALLDALQIERVALVGHSMGGMVATTFAALHPERVRAVILGDIGPEVAATGIERIQRQVREQDVFASVDEAYAHSLTHDPYADRDALRSWAEHNVRELPDGTLTWKYDKALRDGTARYENFAGDEQWAFWSAIDVPVLILRGEHSDILSEDIAAHMLAANPHAELQTLPGAGHSIAIDAPAAVASAVAEFLRH
jgi:pimeloyl-ACP methyl ester carboxylesterase